MSQLALWLIRLYQNTLSKVLPSVCRFQPTCSQYAFEAIGKYGFVRGCWLAAKRILRCNPFSEGGYDPVP
jgi:putative membrane protein insertion efficiency factor